MTGGGGAPDSGRPAAAGEAVLEAPARSLVRLSAAVAAREPARVEAAMRESLAAADPEAVEEALLQSYLFLGYPVALEALATWRRVSGRPAGEAAHGGWDEWRARGDRVLARVYGDQAEALRANVRALHPDMETWMTTEGYGKVLGRPGLPLTERELCIVAVLVVSNAPTQLYSHLRGALAVGVAAPAVGAAVEEAAAHASPDAAAAARATWRELLRRRHGAPEGPGGPEAA